MKQVTLLRKPYQQYLLGVGKKMFRFEGGQPVEVPDEVAHLCLTKTNNKGKPLFEVQEIETNPDADVDELLGIQLEFENWPS